MYSVDTCTLDALMRHVVAAEREGLVHSPFQSPIWLQTIYDTLAVSHGAKPLGVRIVRDGALAMLLPLVIQSENGLRTARFVSFGATDYAQPILGPAAPTTSEDAALLWAAIRKALGGVDQVRFERMQTPIGGRENALCNLAGACRSQKNSNIIDVPGTYEDYFAGHSKHFRKEAKRCLTNLATHGEVHLVRAAAGPPAIEAYRALEALQFAHWQRSPGQYKLNDPTYSAFYQALVGTGVDAGFTDVISLKVGDALAATLFAVRYKSHAILLRIASDLETWHRFSPGRMIVLATIEHYVAQGVRKIDLGIGDYAFKRNIGVQTLPLFDPTEAITWRSAPHTAYMHLRAQARQQPQLKALVDKLRAMRGR